MYKIVNNCCHFNIYKQNKFHAHFELITKKGSITSGPDILIAVLQTLKLYVLAYHMGLEICYLFTEVHTLCM